MADSKGDTRQAATPYSAAQLHHERSNGIEYIQRYIAEKHYKIRIGTGNAFGPQAQDPEAFVRKIAEDGFYSWDFISAGEFLASDRATPNGNFVRVRSAMASALSRLVANASKPFR